MGIIANFNKDDHREQLRESIAAELDRKASETSDLDPESPDLVEDSAYAEGYKSTNKTAWVIGALAIVIALVILLVVTTTSNP
jgi:hypothetical protein